MSAARLCVLGSGSNGNSAWLSLQGRDGPFECLIDAGLSPRMTFERLRQRALTASVPPFLVLSHADGDHWRPTWSRHVARLGVRVVARREHHAELRAAGLTREQLVELVPGRTLDLAPGIALSGVAAPHDESGSTAFRFESRGANVAWLTDLGRATAEVVDLVRGAHLVAIESNYCPQLQLESRRPPFLKARIMGGRGHLSNHECLEALLTLPESDRPTQIVLLHLSRDCNDPRRIRELWLERAPEHWSRVIVASQNAPTPVISIRRAVIQPVLF